MAIGYYQGEVRDLRGNALVNAVVDVFEAGTVTPATLFSNEAGTTPLTSSPLAASAGLALPGKDVAGNVTFFADDAIEYDVRVTDPSGVATFRARAAITGGSAPGNAVSRAYVNRVAGFDVGIPSGSDDDVAIAAARTAAGTGGTIIFSAGIYLTDGIACSTANQRWVVQPGAEVKLKNAANAPVFDVTADGVTIDGGGTINGNRANQTDSTTGETSGVRIVSRARVTVRGLKIIDTLSHGVYMDAVTDCTIDGNSVSGTTIAGNQKQILLYDDVGSWSNVRITNNYVDSTSPANGCIAVTMHVASRTGRGLFVTGNRCIVGDHASENTLGIELFTSGTALMTDCTVEDNIVTGLATGALTYGISLGGSASSAGYGIFNATVTGNTVRDCPLSSYEIIASDTSCTGNASINSGAMSINAGSTTGGLFGVTMTGNTILDSVDALYAIHIGGGTEGLSASTVSANTMKGGAGTFCIYVDGEVTGCTIANNTGADNAGSGVTIAGALIDSSITGNVFDLTGTGSTVDGILIGVTSVARLTISGNVIKGAGRSGIHGNASTVDVTVTGNQITHCQDGIKCNAAQTRWNVNGNTIAHNDDRGLIFVTASTDLAIASNAIHNNPGGNYYTVASTFLTHIINGSGG